MAKRINQLSALRVAAAKGKGLYADGAGLFLQVSSSGSKSWIYRYKVNGRARDMGLGSLTDVSLAKARRLAAEARERRQDGDDPIEARKATRAKERLRKARDTTFDAARDAYIAAHEASWRNAKHRQQWTSTLTTYASPVIGDLSVQDVDTALVMRVLEPIWTTKTETASRVRGRIESILDWAKARGLREGENPARWRGHLQNLLAKRSKVHRVEHHPALPYQEVPAFMEKLQARDSVSARALEFVVITASRTGEALGSRFEEFDLASRAWTVPFSRMKAHREHRVPLSARAKAIVAEMSKLRESAFVFPGSRSGTRLSDMALLMLLRDMGCGHVTTHGFRSSFRDWAAETTNVPGEVAEAALAHVVGDRVEAAYRRGDLFEKRRALMEVWSQFCAGSKGKVLPLRPANATS